MRKILLILSFLSAAVAYATNNNDLDQLNQALARRNEYDAIKEARIAHLSEMLEQPGQDKYALYDSLYEENSSYNYKEAKRYADLMLEEAKREGIASHIRKAQICKGFIYCSAGLFKEGYDILTNLDVPQTDSVNRLFYCEAFQRLLLDMAVYAEGEESDTYAHLREQALIEGSKLLDRRQMFDYWSCETNLLLYHGNYAQALDAIEQTLNDPRLDMHQRAILLSTKAYIVQQQGDTATMQHCNILSAIADIESSTKETVALSRVAWRLYEEGNTELANQYIQIAMDDARFYGARHRMGEISQILPIIERSYNEQMRRKTTMILVLVAITVLLLIICLIALFLLRNRMLALRKARTTIEITNEHLMVANRLKEEYIATFLCWQSNFIEEVDKYQKMVVKRATDRRYEDLLNIPKSVNARIRREDFYKRFDEMFLCIFPTFVDDFNAMLRQEERIELKKGELLNTDLRIFALMRLGITHNEEIAQMLDYTVSTVYTYKTKLKNRSDLTNEDFLKKLMEIPSFRQQEK